MFNQVHSNRHYLDDKNKVKHKTIQNISNIYSLNEEVVRIT